WHNLSQGQDVILRGDIGGFGAGSEFSWNVLAAYSFEICSDNGVTYSGGLGYRLVDVGYEGGSGRSRYEVDVLQHGPLSGLTVTFGPWRAGTAGGASPRPPDNAALVHGEAAVGRPGAAHGEGGRRIAGDGCADCVVRGARAHVHIQNDDV